MTRLLSILIPTLKSRKATFLELRNALQAQIERDGLEADVEILSEEDDGRLSIGSKRNMLLARAAGEFVVFIDDDDEVSDRYVVLIVDVIRRHPDIDCIGIRGHMSFRGRHRHPMVYSLRYAEYRKRDGVYVRPPQHLTPIRRGIAQRYPFLDTSYAEDYEWALSMARDHALQSEHCIDEVLYYYASRRRFWYQRFLDMTQAPRHAFGLQYVNGLRLRRRLASWWQRAPL